MKEQGSYASLSWLNPAKAEYLTQRAGSDSVLYLPTTCELLEALYTNNTYMMNCGAAALVRMDNQAVGEQTADMVLQILQGRALPAMQQATAEILVNQTVTEQQGMTIEDGNGISVLTMEDLPVRRDREA